MPKTRAAKAPPPEDEVAVPATPAKKARASKVTAAAPPTAPVPAPAAVPDVTEPADAAATPPAPTLRKKALVERVVQATGAKRKLVKDVVEATLVALGDALSKGEELNLPPLGRARVNRTRGEGDAAMLIIKLRRGGGKAGKEGLAEPDEAD